MTLARLKLVRERRALTQQQLAEKAGVNRVTITRLERGHDQPVPTTVRKLADALGVPPEELMDPQPPFGLVGGDTAPERLTVLNRLGVTSFLRRAPGLAEVAREAADEIVRFIPDARLRLDVLTDPDYGAGEQLFLGVSTALDDSDALEVLQRFDREWWVHRVRHARGLLCIDLVDE